MRYFQFMGDRTARFCLLLLIAWVGAVGPDRSRTTPSRAPIELLHPGTFHSEEVAADSGEPWLVVFRDGGVVRARTAPIRIEAVEYMGERGQKDGKRVSSSLSDSVLFFVKGIQVPDREVNTWPEPVFFLYPGQEKSIEIPGCEWSMIRALGSVEEHEAEDQVMRLFGGYRLSLYRQDGHQILGPFSIDSESWPPSIEWCGDLDGDGHVDLLVDRGGFNSVEWILYLSSKARRPDLVERVASVFHIGC